jgi:glyoxylase-like metal-dependent hydrolase (beta-lactamase superfamily II)
MKIHSIETGNAKFDGGAVFGVVPKVLWQKVYPADENNLCNCSIRSLLILDDERKILIDTGIGDKQDEKFLKNYHLNGDFSLIASLKEVGVSPEEITHVIITHLHFDHCGGAVKWNNDRSGYELTFPNAYHFVSKKQWEWALNPNRREAASYLKENIIPIQQSGKLILVENEGELLPNINVRFYYGHTEAQMIPFINYNGKTIVYTSDLIASTAHIPMPYIMSYDIRPLVTLQEKESFFKEVIDNDYILFFEHDIFNECCTLKNSEKGVVVDKVFKLKEI